jgi:proteasome accessory factor B
MSGIAASHENPRATAFLSHVRTWAHIYLAMPSTNTAKLHRWVDLMAALLSHHGTQTFEDLAKQVPAYTRGKPDSIKRTFERDKLELRELGIPIETIGNEGDEDIAYRLRQKDFYLPYLSLATERGRSRPSRVDKYGYRALGELTFDADELTAVADAAARVSQLGDPQLAADAASAMRKLAYDLPMDSAIGASDGTLVREPRAPADPDVLRALSRALLTRKRVAITYRSMSSDRQDARTVEPFGLFFLNSHWYLVARDVEADAVKNFRVNRISAAKQNASKSASADYEIPSGFRLRDHARSRQAWELGEGELSEAIIEIRGDSGATLAAAELGARVPGSASRRRFDVRRPDVFARWCLSFAGEIVPVEPVAVAEEYTRQRKATLSLYER